MESEVTKEGKTALLKEISEKLDRIIELMGGETTEKPMLDISKLNEEQLTAMLEILKRNTKSD